MGRGASTAKSHNAELASSKLGCGEGGCGACTVMVSCYSAAEKKVVNSAVNACLAPLCAMDGYHVITIEGIGSSLGGEGLHPVQERLARFNGSRTLRPCLASAARIACRIHHTA